MSLTIHWLQRSFAFAVLLVMVQSGIGADDVASNLARHLQQGQVAAAQENLQERLAAEPNQAQARFALGVVEVLSAIEKLGQDQYRYGALSGSVRNLPVLRLPIPQNPDPQEVTYELTRQIFIDFQTRLVRAEAELAKVDLRQD